METWYRADKRWGWDIAEVQVEKSTENSIWINGQRRKKNSFYDIYFPDRTSAKNFLIERCKQTIREYETDLLDASEALSRLMGEKK